MLSRSSTLHLNTETCFMRSPRRSIVAGCSSLTMSRMATSAPHPVSAYTMSLPRTPAPPVMATVFPLKLYIFVSSARSKELCCSLILSPFLCRLKNRILPLYARRSAAGERDNLVQRRHGRIAGEGRQQRAVRPSQLDRLFRRLAVEQPIDEASREAIAAAYAVQHLQLGRRRGHCRAVHPCHRAPTVVVRVVHLAQRGGHNLRLREALHHLLHHAQERACV